VISTPPPSTSKLPGSLPCASISFPASRFPSPPHRRHQVAAIRSSAAAILAAWSCLAVPLFARTAPGLELGYDDASLAEGRAHKERTTVPQLLTDVAVAADWLQQSLVGTSGAAAEAAAGGGAGGLGCVGFCFGGHVALLAATLPAIVATCDFYGAGVATGRPGGGAPSLELVPRIRGRLLCLCGNEDGLIPPGDVDAIAAAPEAANGQRRKEEEGAAAAAPHRLISLAGGHGFMCEARSDHRPEAAAQGWRAMLDWFSENL